MNAAAEPAALATRLRRSSLALMVGAVAAWVLPGMVVRAAYEERLTPRIDGLIAGRDVHPIEHYLDLIVVPRVALSLALAAAAILLLVLERPAPRSRLTRLVTGGRTGVGAFWRPAVLLVVLTAAALRLPALGATSLWLDEAMIAGVSSAGPEGLFVRMERDSSAGPLHHLVQMWLFGALGQTAWVARLPAALAGLATVLLLLGLHRLGLPRSVALGSAAVVALSPAHVGFSRDATQYAPVVLVTLLVLAAGVAMVDTQRRRSTRWRSILVASLVVAPWAGFQTVLGAAAVLAALALVLTFRSVDAKRALAGLVGLGAAPLVLSAALAYGLIVRRQTRVLGQWYLAEGYPASSAASPARWTLEALDGFMAVVAGGQVTGRWSASGVEGLRQPFVEGSALGWILLLALVVGCVGVARRLAPTVSGDGRAHAAADAGDVAILAAAASIVGSILAAVLGLYPFGGMHQQLHATPIVLVGSAVALHRVLLRTPRRATAGAVLLGSALLLAAALPAIPVVYDEREDIVSAVSVGVDGRSDRGLVPLADDAVWIYRDARPAVRFHFPDRAFAFSSAGSTDPDGMREELARMVDGREEAALVFSQIHPHPVDVDQRRALQALLLADGWTVLEEIHHPNTVVLNVVPPRPLP